jgi:hypothetical protein
MAIKSFIQEQVSCAFMMLDDLKTPVVFLAQGEQTYDHLTGEISSVGACTDSIYGVILDTYSALTEEVNGMPTVKTDILFNKVDLPSNYRTFDTVRLESKDHKVVEYKDDGYTVTLTVSVR